MLKLVAGLGSHPHDTVGLVGRRQALRVMEALIYIFKDDLGSWMKCSSVTKKMGTLLWVLSPIINAYTVFLNCFLPPLVVRVSF